MTKPMRDSNMELARIVAMAMIVFRHFVFHGTLNGWPGPIAAHGALSMGENVMCFLCFLFNAGLNLFILLSGYYGIKLRWKGVIGFWLVSIFYGALSLVVNGVSSPMDIVNVFIISRSGHWFIRAYFLLMFLSPILNAALNNMDVKNLRLAALCTFIVCCISGWAFNNGTSNAMNVLHLVCVYFVGGWIKRDGFTLKIQGSKALLGYCSCAVLNFLGMLVIYYILKKEIGIMYQNNNPLALIGACLLLCWFRGLDLKSKFVNVWASTMFGVLLLSDMVFYGKLYPFINSAYQHSEIPFPLVFAITYIAVFVAGFVVDYLRQRIANPVAAWLASAIDNK